MTPPVLFFPRVGAAGQGTHDVLKGLRAEYNNLMPCRTSRLWSPARHLRTRAESGSGNILVNAALLWASLRTAGAELNFGVFREHC